MERRELFKNAGRLLMLGGFAAGTGYLWHQDKLVTSGKCSIATNCKGCGKNSSCSLDQAEQYRLEAKI